MRILVDTNVILTGAFNPFGYSGTLDLVNKYAQFFHSKKVLEECDNLINKLAKTSGDNQYAKTLVFDYLNKLKSKLVNNSMPPDHIRSNDPDDDLILGAAIQEKLDVICTYNFKDFVQNEVMVKSPFALLRESLASKVSRHIQPVLLGSEGTLLFWGRIHHKSSMGSIIKSNNGTSVFANSDGFITLKGPSVKRHKAMTPLEGDKEIRLSIRFKKSSFEAALWIRKQDNWVKEVISNGVAEFDKKTLPALFFESNHKFCGHVQNISGLGRYVKDKSLINALDCHSLEAVSGSLDLKFFFDNLQVYREQLGMLAVLNV